MRSRSQDSCILCGDTGIPYYTGLADRLFSCPGTWNIVKCPNEACGLAWLNPMPCEDELGQAYLNYFTHKDAVIHTGPARKLFLRMKKGYLARKYHYHRNTLSFPDRMLGPLVMLHPGRRADIDSEVFFLRAKAGGRLLEIGCGSGELLGGMKARGWQVEGVDFDENSVKNARAKGLDVRWGRLEQQDYADGSFDAIVLKHVIEHLVDPVATLHECRRLLHPDGQLVIMTPNLDSWGHRRFKDCWFHLDPPRHLYLFNSRSLSLLARAAGFEGFRCRSLGRARRVFLGSQAIRKKGKLAGRTAYPFWERTKSEGMEIFENWRMMFLEQEGEELLLKVDLGT